MEAGLRNISFRQWLTVTILCYVNLINYMDRFIVAGILSDIQKDFNITNDKGGLLQMVFVISYMLFAPCFGYLGDRYNRKYVTAVGVFLWSLTTMIGSFMTTFISFASLRAFVGIGEASFSTIAPTIISDMFAKNLRTKMLTLFYFAIPVGSGLGYIVGAATAKAAGAWQWGLRVTPFMGGAAVLLILFVLQEPIRGESEGTQNLVTTSWISDIRYLLWNASFILSTFGFICVSFISGALGWWGPKFINLGVKQQPGNENSTFGDLSFVFGLLTMLSGFVGLTLGSFLSQSLKKKYPNIDPVICGIGLTVSMPLTVGCIFTVTRSTALCYVVLFFGQVALNLNWVIVADILLYVVIPTRRSTAEAVQILLSHTFGDAASPFLIGVIAEAFKIVLKLDHKPSLLENSREEDELEFRSLQYALALSTLVEIVGGLFFFLTAHYILRDRTRAEEIMRSEPATDDPNP